MFVVHFRPERGVDGIKALRWVLKRAQRLGLKCVSAIEEPEESRKKGNENERVDDDGGNP
jgi:hypothetical protein